MQGRPEDGKVNFSTRQFAHVLGYKWQGKHTSTKIAEHLRILTATEIEFVFSFKDANGDLVAYNDPIKMIDKGRYVSFQKRAAQDAFAQLHQYTIHPDLVSNMLKGHVRPINYHSFISIENDLAASLYSLLDLYLAKKDFWQRRSLALIMEDLGLSGARNKQRKVRHQTLKALVQELDGKELLSGKLKLSIRETEDKADWKLVAQKVRRITPKKRKGVKPVNSEAEAEALAAEIVDQLKRQGRAGSPNMGVFIYLATYLPREMLYEALSITKGDYGATGAKKSTTALYVGICKRMGKERGFQFPEKE